MAFTPAHAAAILPFRQLGREGTLHLPALVLGCFTPDLGYFFSNPEMVRVAHTALGSITVCLPVGIVFLAVFYLVRRALIFTLPSPHRQLLIRLPEMRRAPIYGPMMAAAGLSLLVGSWTHILWDSFTNWQGFFVRNFDFLRISYHLPFLEWRGPVPLCRILHHGGSIVGLLTLVIAYRSWAHYKRQDLPKGWWRPEYETWRYYFWTLVLLVPAAYVVSQSNEIFELGLAEAFLQGYIFNAVVAFTLSATAFAVVGSLVVFQVWKMRSARELLQENE